MDQIHPIEGNSMQPQVGQKPRVATVLPCSVRVSDPLTLPPSFHASGPGHWVGLTLLMMTLVPLVVVNALVRKLAI